MAENGELINLIYNLRGEISELTAYTHDHRHGVANLSQKMDALSLDVAKQIASSEAKMVVRIEEMAGRLLILERAHYQRQGAVGVFETLSRSPLTVWIFGLAATAFAYLKGWLQIPHQ